MLKIIPDDLSASDIQSTVIDIISGTDGYFNIENSSSYIIDDHVGKLSTNGPLVIIDADVYYEITSFGGLLYYCQKFNNKCLSG